MKTVIQSIIIILLALCICFAGYYPVGGIQKGCTLSNRVGDTGRTFKMKH